MNYIDKLMPGEDPKKGNTVELGATLPGMDSKNPPDLNEWRETCNNASGDDLRRFQIEAEKPVRPTAWTTVGRYSSVSSRKP